MAWIHAAERESLRVTLHCGKIVKLQENMGSVAFSTTEHHAVRPNDHLDVRPRHRRRKSTDTEGAILAALRRPTGPRGKGYGTEEGEAFTSTCPRT